MLIYKIKIKIDQQTGLEKNNYISIKIPTERNYRYRTFQLWEIV